MNKVPKIGFPSPQIGPGAEIPGTSGDLSYFKKEKKATVKEIRRYLRHPDNKTVSMIKKNICRNRQREPVPRNALDNRFGPDTPPTKALDSVDVKLTLANIIP